MVANLYLNGILTLFRYNEKAVSCGTGSGHETRKWTRGMNDETKTPVKIKKQKKCTGLKLKHAKIRISDIIKRI
ncbi:MAG: hypothetical protein AB3K77_13845 [Methanosarcinaceae archaeon]